MHDIHVDFYKPRLELDGYFSGACYRTRGTAQLEATT